MAIFVQQSIVVLQTYTQLFQSIYNIIFITCILQIMGFPKTYINYFDFHWCIVYNIVYLFKMLANAVFYRLLIIFDTCMYVIHLILTICSCSILYYCVY